MSKSRQVAYTMFVALVCVLCLFLSFWQYERGNAKKSILLHYQLMQSKPPSFIDLSMMPEPYQKIKAVGFFGKKVFFLDNQHQSHQFGFHVVLPFYLANGHVLMVDRGFVLGGVNRQLLPDIPLPKKQITLTGMAYYPPKLPFWMTDVFDSKQSQGTIIERLSLPFFEKELTIKPLPFVMNVQSGDPLHLKTEWEVVTVKPERHYAYAIQWLLLAMMIFLFFCYYTKDTCKC